MPRDDAPDVELQQEELATLRKRVVDAEETLAEQVDYNNLLNSQVRRPLFLLRYVVHCCWQNQSDVARLRDAEQQLASATAEVDRLRLERDELADMCDGLREQGWLLPAGGACASLTIESSA